MTRNKWPSTEHLAGEDVKILMIALVSKEGGFIMVVLNFVIAIVALIIAIMAFQRTGGTKELKKNTAELLAKMEKRMREEAGKAEEEKTQQ
jgi:mannitol-specific phosphotransferase system IIBC component